MMHGAVPAFDLLPASMRAPRRSRRAPWPILLPAFAAGLACGLLMLAEGQRRLQDEREALMPLQAQLERVQARQRELAPELQAQQALREQQQGHAQQRSRWQEAGELLQRLAQTSARAARFRLVELKLDEKGLLLTGQIASGDFQNWQRALQLPWGPARLIELSPSSGVGEEKQDRAQTLRFVLRFAAPAGESKERP